MTWIHRVSILFDSHVRDTVPNEQAN